MRHLYRSQQNQVIAGVCGGLGIYFHKDPILFRMLFVFLGMAGGLAVPLYLLLWLTMPAASDVFTQEEQSLREAAEEERYGTKRLHSPDSDRAQSRPSRLAGDGLVLVGVIFVGIGLALLFRNFGLLVWLRALAPLALVALGISLLLDNAGKNV